MSKMERNLQKFDVGKEPNEIEIEIHQLLNSSLAVIFKEYLPYISRVYSVQDYRETNETYVQPTESVASFDITKLVLGKNDKIIDKLRKIDGVTDITRTTG